jgi:sarcosine/dimethylglycine N-methyltransferase
MSGLQTHYSARGIEARILAGIRAAGLNPEQRLSPEELGALDHFHTGGLRASRELLEVAQVPPGCSRPRSAAASTASKCPPITVSAPCC